LAEFVLTMPVEHRLPHGKMKQLLRRAMAGLLPPRVAARGRATVFNSVLRLNLARNRAPLGALFTDPQWLAEPFVDQRASFRALESMAREAPAESVDGLILDLFDIAQLELWLRRLRCESNHLTQGAYS